MKTHVIIQWICLLTSTACLSISYALAGDWLIALLLTVMIVLWIVLKKLSASILLLIFVLLAVVGVLANFSTALMVVATTAALAWWDLTNFGQSIASAQQLESGVLLERQHLQALALAAGASLILATGSSYINLQFPFIVVALLVLAGVACFTYGIQVVQH